MIPRILFIALGALFLLAIGCTGDAGQRDDAIEPASAPGAPAGFQALTQHLETLDPEVYRGEIERLEAALFSTSDPSPERRAKIAEAMRALGRAAAEEPIVLAKALGAELVDLGDRAEAGQDHAFLARQWLRVRTGLFGSASWFHGGHVVAENGG